jgi:coniferyl-aldehyde dehydrogenase
MTTNTRLHVAGDPVRTAYDKLRAAQRAKPFPTVAERRDWLERLDRMLTQRTDDFVRTVSEDFSGRSPFETRLADVVTTLKTIRDARSNVKRWMEAREVSPSAYFLPSRAYVEWMPKGVVAVISPWNYPVNLALAPVAAAFAAGNRVLLKPSELTPKTSALLAAAVRDTFTAEEMAVLEGGPDVAQAVTQLPLDHLLFTGSTPVGTLVAKATAENLVPTTLELGGKSPALVHPKYSIAKAGERIAVGKLFNAGQTCIAPDYALVAEGREQAFEEAFRAAVRHSFPDLAHSPNYTAMASQRGFDRAKSLVEDARSKGAKVVEIAPEGAPDAGSRKFMPVLVFGATDSMRVMQEEIFGPILPVRTFKTLDEAIDGINARPRPLALYYFDDDSRRIDDVLRRTISGGACINDTLMHFAQEELPFGGVGASGMGAYHGVAGFETFSHARSVLAASGLSAARRIQSPPYGKVLDAALKLIVRGLG